MTAVFTAACRMYETEQILARKRLFSDNYARELVGRDGEVLIDRLRLFFPVNFEDVITKFSIRTRFIDKKLLEFAAKKKAFQVVTMGAGLDTRFFRLQKLLSGVNVRFFEIDFSTVLNYKAKRLPKTTAIKYIPADITDTRRWTGQLRQYGFSAAVPSLWIFEGVLMYLSKTDVRDVLDVIHSFTQSAVEIEHFVVGNLVNKAYLLSVQTSMMMRYYSEICQSGNSPMFKWGCDAPVEEFAQHGFEIEVLSFEDADFTARLQFPARTGVSNKHPQGNLFAGAIKNAT
eukprot:TRINITY_DN6085_c0_g1_i5.p1 TRINITY_DN6085_c0_g1~~TRINITY_DN6085_c0_g1_i5.p1  ORF type:complete len:335 (+),score=46.77 TRINITY_DN6085_c0_g1_i5:147-1007(+)